MRPPVPGIVRRAGFHVVRAFSPSSLPGVMQDGRDYYLMRRVARPEF